MELWNQLLKIDHELQLLKHVSGLLGWDQETYMPSQGIEERAEQISWVETRIHEIIISSRTREIFEKAKEERWKTDQEANPFSAEQREAFFREWNRRIDRATRVPTSLVSRLSYAASIAQAKWVQAKKESSFELFKPNLGEVLTLVKEMANALGYQESAYDPLLDEYEPLMRCSILTPLFDQLEKGLVPLLGQILDRGPVDDRCLHLPFPPQRQEEFGKRVLNAMGFPWDRSRLDISAHPFTATLGSRDVRITTRYNESYFPTSFFGIIHEAGHALYELGMGESIQGTLLAEGVSLGIHESQSRFWENCVGRHPSFWKHWYPVLQKEYLPALEGVPYDQFMGAINQVKPSLIRVEADEVSYPLHIILRYRIEKALVEDSLSLSDLPLAWNDGMEKLLGVRPSSDAEGVLQDIHWSMGSFGYFPTYALGTLYAAQFFNALIQQECGVWEEVERGDYSRILHWLRENIHVHGKVFPAEELCRRVTGTGLDPEQFLSYVKGRYLNG